MFGRAELPLAYAEDTFFCWVSLLTRRNSDISEIIVMCLLCPIALKSRVGVPSQN